MKGKIIHICEDEKFIDSAISQFEAVNTNRNVFYVILDDDSIMLKHISKKYSVIKKRADSILDILEHVNKNDIVIFHSFSPIFYSFILKLPRNIKTVWLCFGFEVYNDVNYFKEKLLLDKLTLCKFPSKKIKTKKRIKIKIKKNSYPILRLFNSSLPYLPVEIKKRVFKRANYLGSSFKEEFNQVCNLIQQKKKFFEFWYYPLELIVDVKAPITHNKNTIIIGNSGFKTGNHLDVFNKIKIYNLKLEKVVVPLNYGIEDYIVQITQKGNEVFGEKMYVLNSFMPLDEYNKILNRVGVAILNNRRQQAVGNTIALIWFGAKVFLSKQNPFYQYLKRIGIQVYCYETELNESSINQLLTLEEIKLNRSILFKVLNKEKLISELENQILKIND